MSTVTDIAVENGRRVLSAADILGAPPDCPEERFLVPEWGGEIVLRAPTAADAAAIKESAVRLDESGSVAGMDIGAMERRQILHCVIEPKLTAEQVEQIQRRFGPSWQRVIARLDKLSGGLGKPIGEAAERTRAEKSFRDAD